MEFAHIDRGELEAADGERRRPAPGDTIRVAIAALTLEQKVRILTGADNFNLVAEPAIALHGMSLSDGPAGVRGPVLDPGDRSSSPPAPMALAATWDPALVEEVAAEIGLEAKAKGVDVLLGPTLNLARTPFSGRGFESFGEDPVLAAGIGVAFVRGLQSAGVAATAKHFVGNDTEVDRWSADSRIDETVLREVYLVPFEAAVREADCDVVMAGYNTVNGTPMTEHGHLLETILKGEWGFGGVVVSDWFAARSTLPTANAGLDLVMPGPSGPWGGALVEAVTRGEVDEAAIDEKLLRLLRLASKVGAVGEPRPAPKPGPHADRTVLRHAAARSFVLLSNVGSILPLTGAPDSAENRAAHPAPAAPRSIALIGPNVIDPQYQGRGSAEVGIALPVPPVEGLREALDAVVVSGGADVPPEAGARPVLRVAQGCRTWNTTPLPDGARLLDPETGAQGVRLEVYDRDGATRYAGTRVTSEVTWWDPETLVTADGIGRIVLRATYTAGYTGNHRVAVGGIGELELNVRTGADPATDANRAEGEAGTIRIGGTAPHPSDVMVSHAGPFEFGHELMLVEGETVEFTATCVPDGYRHDLVRFRVGIVPLPSAERLLEEAVEAAHAADVAILVVGSSHATESEGYDRDSLALPGGQDELIAAVAAVNPRTVVVVNSGMPVLMPWADRVAAIVQAWFPGQEFGHALADVLLGRTEPSGRLPVTIPRSESGLPVGRAVPVSGRLEYDEGLLVGYRGYDRAMLEPRFPFGHGLGYTSWSFKQLDVPVGPTRAGADVEIIVAVENLGARSGHLVVQAYLSSPDQASDARRPVRALAAFTRVYAASGAEQSARIRLPNRAFAQWDPVAGAWSYPSGTYTVEVGFSSRDLRMRAEIEIG
ncbi:glycoside hydrolase family 3 protein [Actinospica sp. MGRD01-02]|uniref:Glycoside hydrolase family 3 protein n=1 Tax=Actinospica acidithermotolerans TaxID=2828514 RepID=A0A941IJS2_9ACTN|nr:glycoside hydrolase family 3 C-terminal domain-containing protein [Actinospica acidithermotolerans]MBR7826001.1 glycoside hydrolase family 3 protein [Actinospica acidithermotolerans]